MACHATAFADISMPARAGDMAMSAIAGVALPAGKAWRRGKCASGRGLSSRVAPDKENNIHHLPGISHQLNDKCRRSGLFVKRVRPARAGREADMSRMSPCANIDLLSDNPHMSLLRRIIIMTSFSGRNIIDFVCSQNNIYCRVNRISYL